MQNVMYSMMFIQSFKNTIYCLWTCTSVVKYKNRDGKNTTNFQTVVISVEGGREGNGKGRVRRGLWLHLQCFSSLKNEIWGKNIHIFQIGAVGISYVVAILFFSLCMFEIFCDLFSRWKEGERGKEGKQGMREGRKDSF